MTPSSPNPFKVGNEEYCFEIMAAPYTKRPLQVVDEQSRRLEDRFHRTVKITRLSDGRSWTGASDIESWYMNDLPAYLQGWLADCFTQWDPNAIPEGFEIPQGAAPPEPAKHHCPEFPIAVATVRKYSSDSAIVDIASEESFPASDPPEWSGLKIA